MKRNNSFNFISKIIHSINEKNNENSLLLYQANRRMNELFNKYFVFNVFNVFNVKKQIYEKLRKVILISISRKVKI